MKEREGSCLRAMLTPYDYVASFVTQIHNDPNLLTLSQFSSFGSWTELQSLVVFLGHCCAIVVQLCWRQTSGMQQLFGLDSYPLRLFIKGPPDYTNA